MHRYSQKFIIRKDAKKLDGLFPLYLQVFVNGERIRQNLYLYVSLQQWNQKKQIVIIKDIDREIKINQVLSSLKLRVENVFFEARMTAYPLNKKTFLKALTKERIQEISFYKFMEEEMENRKSLVAPGTFKQYKRSLKYIKSIVAETSVSEFNYSLIERIEKKMRKDNFQTNSRSGIHKHVKLFLNIALKKGVITQNPYINFKLKHARTVRTYHTSIELKKIYDYYKAGNQSEPLRIYLFMCFTSLRIQDVLKIRYEDIIEGVIHFQPQKTKQSLKLLHIPLTDAAKDLIIDHCKGNIFQSLTPEYINRELKNIIPRAGVNKKVSCHVGRHTFATLFLQAGGKIERLQQMMGHSKIETTMIYTHVTLEDKKESIELLNRFFKI